jgi:hypothetical protein
MNVEIGKEFHFWVYLFLIFSKVSLQSNGGNTRTGNGNNSSLLSGDGNGGSILTGDGNDGSYLLEMAMMASYYRRWQ